MRWRGREQSKNIEDRRGVAPQVAMGGGLIGILVILGAILFGLDPKAVQQFLGAAAQQQQQQQQGQAQEGAGKEDEAKQFVGVVLKDTENVWSDIFREELQSRYKQPELVLYDSKIVSSACGNVPSAAGPFYCPADQKIYINPEFFNELHSRHNAGGDFAAAYVIAHEVAHHVQFLTGYSKRVNDFRRKNSNKVANNQMSVRLELQADYLAGVWAHHLQKDYGVLEVGDLAEAINAANQIGDDVLQKKSTGTVIPDRFTHGTAKQRAYWFKAGLKSGDFSAYRALFELPYREL